MIFWWFWLVGGLLVFNFGLCIVVFVCVSLYLTVLGVLGWLLFAGLGCFDCFGWLLLVRLGLLTRFGFA